MFHIDLRASEKYPEEFYNFLSSYKRQLKFPNSEEYEKVYPQNGNTDEEKFDVSLYTKITNAILDTHLRTACCKQKQEQMEKDKKFANCARCWRNMLFHKGDKDIFQIQSLWKHGKKCSKNF